MASAFECWGATPEERAAPYPCDDVVPAADLALWRAISIDATPGMVFRWLCQLRVAPYSYDWLDNFGRRSPRVLTPGLDDLATGQRVMRIFELVSFQRDRHFTLRTRHRLFGLLAVSYLTRADGAGTRLTVKIVSAGSPHVGRKVLPAGDLVMMRKQLRTLKRLAERDENSRSVA